MNGVARFWDPFLVALFVAATVFGIHFARLGWYELVIAGSTFEWAGLELLYVVAWAPPFVVSLLASLLLYQLLTARFRARWVLAFGLAVGAIWKLGASHTFFRQPSPWDLIGTYGWYAMPLLAATLVLYTLQTGKREAS